MAQNCENILAEQLHKVVKDFMFGQIKEFCRRTKLKPSVSLRFVEDLDFEQLDIAMLLYDVEQHFNISLLDKDDEEVEAAATVEEFINFIVKKLK